MLQKIELATEEDCFGDDNCCLAGDKKHQQNEFMGVQNSNKQNDILSAKDKVELSVDVLQSQQKEQKQYRQKQRASKQQTRELRETKDQNANKK